MVTQFTGHSKGVWILFFFSFFFLLLKHFHFIYLFWLHRLACGICSPTWDLTQASAVKAPKESKPLDTKEFHIATTTKKPPKPPFLFFGCMVCGDLSSSTRDWIQEHRKLQVLTTGPPGKSLEISFLNLAFWLFKCCALLLTSTLSWFSAPQEGNPAWSCRGHIWLPWTHHRSCWHAFSFQTTSLDLQISQHEPPTICRLWCFPNLLVIISPGVPDSLVLLEVVL